MPVSWHGVWELPFIETARLAFNFPQEKFEELDT